MKRIGLIAILAVVASAVSGAFAFADDSASIRNCTWCHGTGAQGYTVAPRLAGQRSLYIESPLHGYAAHIRDNPLSKQYMWSAAANRDTDAVRNLADYFASLPPKSANDGRRELVHRGEVIYL